MVIVNSELVQLLEDDEVRAVLGHEVGHILSDHVPYQTALVILLQMTLLGPLPRRFKSIFREAGEGVEKAGEKLSDWLRRE